MKVSLKLVQDEEKPQSPASVLLRTKIPISAFGLPFLSSLSLSSSSPSSPLFSLRTHFSSGPSLKLSYSNSLSPLSLSLSSGVSVSGSPIDSPLTISAQFSLYPLHHTPSPTFSLLIKPRFGDFSLKKPVFSQPSPDPSPITQTGTDPLGFVPIERDGSWKDLNLGPTREKSLVSGVSLWARTALPVTKRVALRFRWGLNFPADVRKSLPFLSVDKIGIERVEEGKEGRGREEGKKKKGVDDFELVKGMCVSVGRELDELRRENREMRRCLDELRFGEVRKQDPGYRGGYSDGVSKRVTKPLIVSEDLGEIEGWNKVKKKGVIKEPKSSLKGANELESELQKAIMAASASQ